MEEEHNTFNLRPYSNRPSLPPSLPPSFRWVPVVTALKHLVREWLCENPTQLIMGFAGRKEAEVLFKEKPIGNKGGREGEGEGEKEGGKEGRLKHDFQCIHPFQCIHSST